MDTIVYVPLEPYKERYTAQMSAPGGWMEKNWERAGLNVLRVEGQALSPDRTIKTGVVLDAHGRSHWACSQVMALVKLLSEGQLDPRKHVIYFDDFWHPGISALPYIFHLTGVHIPMYAFLWAQSVDIHDFTYPMRHWLRPFEVGIGKVLSGIFVASTCLRDMCIYAGIGNEDTVHCVGLPYNSAEVKRAYFPQVLPEKKLQVVYSSRWDREKCPDFFLQVVERVHAVRPDISFVVTTSADRIRSNDRGMLARLEAFLTTSPARHALEVRCGQTKAQYYHNLLESKIQFNCADQDFVSWTLLEATTAGCRPVYPNYLSFPEALQYQYGLMYEKGDVDSAAHKILETIDEEPRDWSWVYLPYDHAAERIAGWMREGSQ